MATKLRKPVRPADGDAVAVLVSERGEALLVRGHRPYVNVWNRDAPTLLVSFDVNTSMVKFCRAVIASARKRSR